PTGEKGPRSQGSRHLDDAVEEERVCAGNGVGESFRGNAGDDNIRQRPPVRRNEVAVGLDFVFFTVHRRSPDQFDIGTRPRRGDVQRLAAGENSVGGDHGADDVVDWVRALVRNAQEPGNGGKAGQSAIGANHDLFEIGAGVRAAAEVRGRGWKIAYLRQQIAIVGKIVQLEQHGGVGLRDVEREVVRGANGSGEIERDTVCQWYGGGRSRASGVQEYQSVETQCAIATGLRAVIREFEFAVGRTDERVIADDVRKGAPWPCESIAPLHLEQV